VRDYAIYTIVSPTGKIHRPPPGTSWRFTKERLQELLEDNRIWFGATGNNVPRLKRFLSEVAQGVPATTWWGHKDVGHSDEAKKESKVLFGSDLFPTPKPERLLQRILHIGSNKDDLVLDFFAGSGTTGAVALKMGRRFALVEQMDYLETMTIPRLEKVIKGEQGGISKYVDWQGGGSAVVCELMQWNGRYIDRVQAARTVQEVQALWEEMQEKAFLSYRVDYAHFDEHAEEFAQLSLADQKRFLRQVLDKNQLYVHLSEIDDSDYQVSEQDKRLNRQFYQRG